MCGSVSVLLCGGVSVLLCVVVCQCCCVWECVSVEHVCDDGVLYVLFRRTGRMTYLPQASKRRWVQYELSSTCEQCVGEEGGEWSVCLSV